MISKLFNDLTDYMVQFPIKWYTFANRILGRSTKYKNIVVFNKNIIERNLDIVLEIEKIIKTRNDLREKQENKDFILWYFHHEKSMVFLENWFYILTIRAISEICNEFVYSALTNKNFFIQTNNIRFIFKNEKVLIQNFSTVKVFSLTYDYNYYCYKEQLRKVLIAFLLFF